MGKRITLWVLVVMLIISMAILAYVLFKSYQTQQQVEGLDDHLNVFIWEEYIPDEVVLAFEEEFSVDVVITTYEDEDEIITALQDDPGAYDVIFPSASLLTELVDYKLVSELNHSNLPNFSNVMEKYQDPLYDPDNKYSVIYDFGFTPLVYNAKYVSEINSWEDLTNPKYAGKVAILNNSYEVIGAVLVNLGYTLDETDPVAFAEAQDLLSRIIENGGMIEDSISIRDALINEDIWIAQIYNGEGSVANDENSNLQVIIPETGALLFYDLIALPVGTPRQQTAEAFINYILRPDVHAEITNFTYYANPNQASHDAGLIDEEQLDNPFIYPLEKDWNNLVGWGIKPVADNLYVQTWSKLLLLGQ